MRGDTRAVALVADDHNGRVRADQSADVVQPVSERTMVEVEAVFDDLTGLGFGRPQDEEDGVALQEEGVGAVINVLAAKVPDTQGDRRFAAFDGQGKLIDLDAVRGGNGGIEVQTAQAAARLSFAEAAVAENEQLAFDIVACPSLEVGEVRPNIVENIFVMRGTTKSNGEIREAIPDKNQIRELLKQEDITIKVAQP